MKSLSPSCFKCQIMLDISISPRRASVKSSWTLLKALKLPSAPPVASDGSDSVLSQVWNVIVVVPLHDWHQEEAPNVSSISIDGLRNRLWNRARCKYPIHYSSGGRWWGLVAPMWLVLKCFWEFRMFIACVWLVSSDDFHVMWRSVGKICNQ